MDISPRLSGRILYMQLKGEIDEHNAATARQAADRLADDYAYKSERVIFDLANVSFMDSTGIGFLIGRYKKFGRYGVPVYVTNPTRETDKILTVSGVYAIIPKV